MAKTALVTGAAGFVGRHFTAHLADQGWDVYCIDPQLGSVPPLVEDLVQREIVQYDLVIHAAARSAHRVGIDTDLGAGPYNAMLDAAMIEWAIRTKQPRFVYLSSCAVYTDWDYDHIDPAWRDYQAGPSYNRNVPITERRAGITAHRGHPKRGQVDIYGAVKRAGERLCEQATAAGVGVTIVRPFSGYGEDQGADWPFGAFRDRARAVPTQGGPFEIWGSGQQVRDWIHIDDIVAGTLALVDAEVRDPINLCTGQGTSMLTLASMFLAHAGAATITASRRDRPEGAPYRVGDPTALHRFYVPRITLEEGVRRAMAR